MNRLPLALLIAVSATLLYAIGRWLNGIEFAAVLMAIALGVFPIFATDPPETPPRVNYGDRPRFSPLQSGFVMIFFVLVSWLAFLVMASGVGAILDELIAVGHLTTTSEGYRQTQIFLLGLLSIPTFGIGLVAAGLYIAPRVEHVKFWPLVVATVAIFASFVALRLLIVDGAYEESRSMLNDVFSGSSTQLPSGRATVVVIASTMLLLFVLLFAGIPYTTAQIRRFLLR